MRVSEIAIVVEFAVLVAALIKATHAGARQGSAMSVMALREWIFVGLSTAIVGYLIITLPNQSRAWGSPVSVCIGLAIATFGLAIAIAAYLNLGSSFSGHTTPNERHGLKTNGIHRIARHPAYIGLILFSIGTTLVFERVILIPLTIALIWQVRRQAISEESKLVARYEQTYLDYANSTKRWGVF